MEVLILYDYREREKYRSTLVEMISDAGGVVSEVDAGEGTFDISERMKEKSLTADVVLVDLTVPNINVGYEIGHFFRRNDDRLFLFSFNPEGFSGGIPFYFKQKNCYPLHGVQEKTQEGIKLRKRFVEHIKAVGSRKQKYPIERYPCFPSSDEKARVIFMDYENLYRAPAAAFYFGEFAVTVGHPALHLPLPRYVYVGIKPSSERGCLSNIKFIQEGSNSIVDCRINPIHRDFVNKTSLILKELGSKPLDICVWSQVPTMCGLGTSSALAACIALYLSKREMISDYFPKQSETEVNNYLSKETKLESIFKLAWKIDASFHSFFGSGAGVFASLVGTSRALPLLYFSESRKIWKGDIGRFPWKLGASEETVENIRKAFKLIDKIRCFGFPLIGLGEFFQKGHFALVYTGHKKSTGYAMKNVAAIEDYFIPNINMVRSIIESEKKLDSILRYPVSQRFSDAYKKLVNQAIKEKKNSAHSRESHMGALKEILLAAYGCCGLVGINSYWSPNDYSYLTCMEGCQKILEALGVAEINRRDGNRTYEPTRLATCLNSIVDNNGKRVFGAKITGGGTGGDLFVASNIVDKWKFEKTLKRGIDDAKDIVQTDLKEFGRVHFSSTWIDKYPENYKAEPAQMIFRK